MTTHPLKLRLAAGLLLAVATVLAHAEPDRARLEAKIPDFKVRWVRPAVVPGLWEVAGVDGDLLYVDDAAKIAILGNMVELDSGQNLTSQRLGEIRSLDFGELPPELAIKRVHGKGERRLAVFADPDCPYCHELEQRLAAIDNVTIYLYLYPLTNAHPDAAERAHRIWCSKDPAAVWNDWMLKGVEPAPRQDASCAAPLEKIDALSKKAWVNGTPSMVFGSGRTLNGLIAAEDLERLLAEPALLAASGGQG